MSEKIHLLAQLLLKRETVDECNVEEIRSIANRYPYFAPAQFLLLEKLKQEDTEAYQQQLQKAILYYPDPLEFEFLINSDKFYTEDFPLEAMAPEPGTIEETPPTSAPGGNVHITEPEAFNISETESEPAVEIAPTEPLNGPAEQEPIPSVEAATPAFPPVQEVPPEPAIAFEPFHTVDYFASQGIKIQEEQAPKDHFGKQLKSFTEWLRTMKRLPATEAPASLDQQTEKNVQSLAENSVHQTDVVTEAMAEIWLKQGKREKAIEVFKKLCLLNPSKNAYFAAKIEHLKGS